MNTPTIYFIPYWIYKSIQRSRISLLSIKKLEELNKACSLEDIVLAESITRFCLDKLGTNVSYSYEFISGGQLGEDYQCVVSSNLYDLKAAKSRFGNGKRDIQNSVSDVDGNTIESARFLNNVKDQSVEKQYIVTDSGDRDILVILKQYYQIDNVGNDLPMIREIVQKMYSYAERNVVASTPLFSKYLQLLSFT